MLKVILQFILIFELCSYLGVIKCKIHYINDWPYINIKFVRLLFEYLIVASIMFCSRPLKWHLLDPAYNYTTYCYMQGLVCENQCKLTSFVHYVISFVT